VLWLLDGIDEIRDPGERTRLVEEVKATTAVRPQDRWVVATRPAGEPRGVLGAGWSRALLPSLSDAQVEGVLARWSAVLEKKEGLALDTRRVARDLRRDPGLRQVRTNALLLTLAILFFKTRKRLPHDRWEFYETAEKALKDAWVNYRIRSAERYQPGDYLPERLALGGMENGYVLFEREAHLSIRRPHCRGRVRGSSRSTRSSAATSASVNSSCVVSGELTAAWPARRVRVLRGGQRRRGRGSCWAAQ
jgi:hypothetical protein